MDLTINCDINIMGVVERKRIRTLTYQDKELNKLDK